MWHFYVLIILSMIGFMEESKDDDDDDDDDSLLEALSPFDFEV